MYVELQLSNGAIIFNIIKSAFTFPAITKYVLWVDVVIIISVSITSLLRGLLWRDGIPINFLFLQLYLNREITEYSMLALSLTTCSSLYLLLITRMYSIPVIEPETISSLIPIVPNRPGKIAPHFRLLESLKHSNIWPRMQRSVLPNACWLLNLHLVLLQFGEGCKFTTIT